jgi:hypothetical protein
MADANESYFASMCVFFWLIRMPFWAQTPLPALQELALIYLIMRGIWRRVASFLEMAPDGVDNPPTRCAGNSRSFNEHECSLKGSEKSRFWSDR